MQDQPLGFTPTITNRAKIVPFFSRRQNSNTLSLESPGRFFCPHTLGRLLPMRGQDLLRLHFLIGEEPMAAFAAAQSPAAP